MSKSHRYIYIDWWYFLASKYYSFILNGYFFLNHVIFSLITFLFIQSFWEKSIKQQQLFHFTLLRTFISLKGRTTKSNYNDLIFFFNSLKWHPKQDSIQLRLQPTNSTTSPLVSTLLKHHMSFTIWWTSLANANWCDSMMEALVLMLWSNWRCVDHGCLQLHWQGLVIQFQR